MKRFFISIIILFPILVIGQIHLEKSYNQGNPSVVQRVKLEYAGEKYYVFLTASNQLQLYNADHTLWKTINLTAPASTQFSTAQVFHVSQAKINPNDALEIIYGYFVTGSGYVVKVVSEDGTVLKTINQAYQAMVSEMPGLPDKLITYGDADIAKVYSIPDLVLEHSYSTQSGTFNRVFRLNLQNFGEKYYVLSNTSQSVSFFNADHSLWKTIALPKLSNASYRDFKIISPGSDISPMVLGYTYAYYTFTDIYTGKVVNENGLELLSIPNAQTMDYSVLPGYPDKLIAYYGVEMSPDYWSKVYALPSLTDEFTLENRAQRILMENGDVKYYTFSKPGKEVKIYNADFSLWKTISLTIPYTSYDLGNLSLSETKIIDDAFIEVIYDFQLPCSTGTCVNQSYLVSENGEVLLNIDNAKNLRLSELPGGQNKLIADLYDSSVSPYSYSDVYGLGILAINQFDKNGIEIAPNPASGILNINTTKSIIKAVFVDVLGKEVLTQEHLLNNSLTIENLKTGLYFLALTDADGQQSTHKILIARYRADS